MRKFIVFVVLVSCVLSVACLPCYASIYYGGRINDDSGYYNIFPVNVMFKSTYNSISDYYYPSLNVVPYDFNFTDDSAQRYTTEFLSTDVEVGNFGNNRWGAPLMLNLRHFRYNYSNKRFGLNVVYQSGFYQSINDFAVAPVPYVITDSSTPDFVYNLEDNIGEDYDISFYVTLCYVDASGRYISSHTERLAMFPTSHTYGNGRYVHYFDPYVAIRDSGKYDYLFTSESKVFLAKMGFETYLNEYYGAGISYSLGEATSSNTVSKPFVNIDVPSLRYGYQYGITSLRAFAKSVNELFSINILPGLNLYMLISIAIAVPVAAKLIRG